MKIPKPVKIFVSLLVMAVPPGARAVSLTADTTWPSSATGQNVGGTVFTVDEDLTLTIEKDVSVTSHGIRPVLHVADGKTLTIDLTSLESDITTLFNRLSASGTGRVRVKGNPENVRFGGGWTMTGGATFDVADFVFVDAQDQPVDAPLVFSNGSKIHRWPVCGYEFREAQVNLVGPDLFTGDTLELSATGLRQIGIYNNTSLPTNICVTVPADCKICLKSGTVNADYVWNALNYLTNTFNVVLDGGTLDFQTMSQHVFSGDISGTGKVRYGVSRSRTGDEWTCFAGSVDFTGEVEIINGFVGNGGNGNNVSFGTNTAPGSASNTVTMKSDSRLGFFLPNGRCAPEVAIGSLIAIGTNVWLYAERGQTITVNELAGTVRCRGAGSVVLGPSASARRLVFGAETILTSDPSFVLDFGSLGVESVLGGQALDLDANDVAVVGTKSNLPVRVVNGATTIHIEGNRPLVAGGAGTAVLAGADWRETAALWLDPSQTNLIGLVGCCTKEIWVEQSGVDPRITYGTVYTNGYPLVEYLPDCRGQRSYFARNTRLYNKFINNLSSYELMPGTYLYAVLGGQNGLTYLAGGVKGGMAYGHRNLDGSTVPGSEVRRLPLGTGDPTVMTDSAIPSSRLVVMVFGSQQGGGSALIGTSDGAFEREDPPVASAPLMKVRPTNTRVWLDGEEVDPTETGLSGGWQIVSIDVTGHDVNGLGWVKNYTTAGGANYGEVLVFTNMLSDAARTDVEVYLARKWGLDAQYRGDRGLLPQARLVGQTGTVALAPSNTVVLGGSYSGTIHVPATATAVLADDRPVPFAEDLDTTGLIAWFDPERVDSICFPTPGTSSRKTEMSYLLQRNRTLADVPSLPSSEVYLITPGSRRPRIGSSDYGFSRVRGFGPERNWIDFSDVCPTDADTGNSLRFCTVAKQAPVLNGSANMVAQSCLTVFMAMDSSNGGTPVITATLGTSGDIRARVSDATWTDPIFGGGTVANVTQGDIRLNGIPVSNDSGFTGGPEVFSFSTKDGPASVGLVGNLNHSQRGLTKGEIVGEMLFFSSKVEDRPRQDIEAYLMHKWCGTLPSGFSDLSAATVTGSGTVNAVSASRLPRFDAAFAGTVSVAEASPVFRVSVDTTKVDQGDEDTAAAVTSALVLPNAALSGFTTAQIDVAVSGRRCGDYVLVNVREVSSPIVWTVNVQGEGKAVAARDGASVVLQIRPRGTVLIIR